LPYFIFCKNGLQINPLRKVNVDKCTDSMT
jgi:hypothetical protein